MVFLSDDADTKIEHQIQLFNTAEYTKRFLTTVGFPALQFNTAKKQFVTTRKVPIAAIDDERV
jgi:hypothetical protein